MNHCKSDCKSNLGFDGHSFFTAIKIYKYLYLNFLSTYNPPSFPQFHYSPEPRILTEEKEPNWEAYYIPQMLIIQDNTSNFPKMNDKCKQTITQRCLKSASQWSTIFWCTTRTTICIHLHNCQVPTCGSTA